MSAPEASEEVTALAKRYIQLTTDDDGNELANIYETQAFKSLYDPNGVNERKLRLPRTLLQVHNRFDVQKNLFQKVYYHPGLLSEDEVILRNMFD